MQTSKHSCFTQLTGVQLNSQRSEKRTVVYRGGEEVWNKKRTHSFFYWCLKKYKRGLDHHFLCWVERQTLMSFTAVFLKTRHFCNVNLFLMSMILFMSYFFILQKKTCILPKVPLLFRQITCRLWSMQITDDDVPLWNILVC